MSRSKVLRQIADNMMVGSSLTKQGFNTFFASANGRSEKVYRTCALGAAHYGRQAAHFENGRRLTFREVRGGQPEEWNSAMLEPVSLPYDVNVYRILEKHGGVREAYYVQDAIVYLNDFGRWSREKIAGWLLSVANEWDAEEAARRDAEILVTEFEAAALSRAEVEAC